MQKYYLAIDIGASSGRHMIGWIEDDMMHLEEVYRFENGMQEKGESLVWDMKHLFSEIVNGMKKCAEAGKIPVTMSIDTWGVDYVLLDENDQILGESFGYRDNRTDKMDEEVYQYISEKDLYARTGTQKQMFNTIYQLMADKMKRPEVLEKAKTLLMFPDYFQFLLTDKKVSEYTDATTTQLVDPEKNQWDKELIQMLGYPAEMFLPLQMPGTEVGGLKPEIQEKVGFNCQVVLCASHDTASAVMAMPVVEGSGLYISSGTWSLMGIETEKAICTEESRRSNLTNEGGYDYRYRYLRNIMGLWMIQSVRRELGKKYSYPELCDLAEQCKEFPSRVDVNDASFMAPKSMIKAIQKYCEKTGQKVPETPGELATVIYQSLAMCYGETVRAMEESTGKTFDSIHVIGGGSNASYLNQLTANATGKTVYAGPGEATAIGNLMAQMIRTGEFLGLSEARKCVYTSFDVQTYQPKKNNKKIKKS